MKDDVIFIDTNIIVYAYDTFDKKKHNTCKPIVEATFKGERKCAVSNQVLAELFFVLTQKLKNPVPVGEAETIVSGIVDSINWIKIDYTHETVKKAVTSSKTSNISIWDCLIAATALENGITKIYTENAKDFKKLAGITVINPIA